jgi:hypothetical protein
MKMVKTPVDTINFKLEVIHTLENELIRIPYQILPFFS